MKIIFTSHAKIKFKVFERHGFKITEDNIKETIKNPAAKIHGKRTD